MEAPTYKTEYELIEAKSLTEFNTLLCEKQNNKWVPFGNHHVHTVVSKVKPFEEVTFYYSILLSRTTQIK